MTSNVKIVPPGVFFSVIPGGNIPDFREEAMIVDTGGQTTLGVVTIGVLKAGSRESPHAAQNEPVFPPGIAGMASLDRPSFAESASFGPLIVDFIESTETVCN